MQKGYVHFLRQEFKEANQQFRINSINAEDLFEVSLKYEASKGTKELLSGDQLAKFLIEVMREPYSFRVGSCFKILRYDSEKRQLIQEHAKAVFAFMKIINPLWKPEINYEPEKRKLTLRGVNLNKLSHEIGHFAPWGKNHDSIVSILHGLKLDELDVSSTSISNFKHFLGIDIKKLSIRHCPINNLTGLENIKSLQELIVHKSQFSDKQLKNIPSNISIIIQ